jgi:hypothetical protein
MEKRMRNQSPSLILSLVLVGFASCSYSQNDDALKGSDIDMVVRDKAVPHQVQHGEIVNRVYAPQIHDWVVLDEKRLILYVSRNRPYLVTLRRPARSLKNSTVIGLNRRDHSIDARFDQIYIDGSPYSIQQIEKLTSDTAKRLRGIEVIVEDDG